MVQPGRGTGPPGRGRKIRTLEEKANDIGGDRVLLVMVVLSKVLLELDPNGRLQGCTARETGRAQKERFGGEARQFGAIRGPSAHPSARAWIYVTSFHRLEELSMAHPRRLSRQDSFLVLRLLGTIQGVTRVSRLTKRKKIGKPHSNECEDPNGPMYATLAHVPRFTSFMAVGRLLGEKTGKDRSSNGILSANILPIFD